MVGTNNMTTCRECGLTSDKPEGDLQGNNWIIAGKYILCPKCREREWPVGDYVRTPKIRMKISESLKASWRRKHEVMV